MNFKKTTMSIFSSSFFIFVFAVLLAGSLHAADNDDLMPAGRYAQMVYLRMISIAKTILEYDKEVIFRLENKRHIDKALVKARFISARLQFKKLLKLGRYLESKMASSDAAKARVESLRRRLPYFIKAHRANMKKINSLGDFDDVNLESDQLIAIIEQQNNQQSVEKLTINNLESAF
ncbi:MAG: hypothetical protein ACQETH_10080 [Candidatus Rifleibacteriota bacterium]